MSTITDTNADAPTPEPSPNCGTFETARLLDAPHAHDVEPAENDDTLPMTRVILLEVEP